jgi:hypothetical protein
MSNEIDELRNQLEQTTKQLKSFESSIARTTRSNNIFDNSLKTSADIEKELNESEKQLSKAISGSISGLTGFAKSLSNSSGSFAPLTNAMKLGFKVIGKVMGGLPFVGKALKGFSEGVGEVASFMVESFDKSYQTFEKLSDSGVVTSFTDMKHAARAMQLNYSQSENILTKHSKNLALFAGSATKGRKEFERISVSSYDVRRDFQKLGISSEEFSEMQLSYLNQQMRTGRGQKKTIDEMIQGSVNYIKELDTISKITGASKKDIQTAREARMNDAAWRAGMVDVPGKLKDTYETFLDLTAAQSGKLTEEGMREYLTTGDAGRAKAAEMLASFGDQASAVTSILTKFRNGEMKAGVARNEINRLSGIARKAALEETRRYGDATVRGKYSIEQANAEMHANKDTQKLLEEQNAKQAQIITDKDSENAKLADTKQALEQAGRDIEQMSTSSELVTGIMKHMATGLEVVTEKLYEMAGEDLPAHLAAKKTERQAIEKESEARKKLKDAESGETGKNRGIRGSLVDSITTKLGVMSGDVYLAKKNLEEAQKQLAIATAKRIQAEKDAGVGVFAPSSVSGGENATRARLPGAGEEPKSAGEAGGVKLSTIRSKSGQSTSVATEFAKNFQGLIDWFDASGYKIKSLGGYADRNIAGTNTPSYHSRGAAIDINPAENPMGSQRITDMPEGTRQAAKSMGLGWGLDWPNKSDAMHFSAGRYELGSLTARTGGIFSGPESGYLAELHGDESVSKIGDGSSVSKTSLGSGSMMTNSSNKITEMFNNLFEKMDTLIDLSDTSMENQKKFLEAKLN